MAVALALQLIGTPDSVSSAAQGSSGAHLSTNGRRKEIATAPLRDANACAATHDAGGPPLPLRRLELALVGERRPATGRCPRGGQMCMQGTSGRRWLRFGVVGQASTRSSVLDDACRDRVELDWTPDPAPGAA
jgi:hypothetical protein